MAEFTEAEVAAALEEFLPTQLRSSVSVHGEPNSRERVSQVLAIVLHALVVDADAPFYLRSIAAAHAADAASGLVALLDGVISDLRFVVGEDSPAVPAAVNVAAAETALAGLVQHLQSSVVPPAAVDTLTEALDATVEELAQIVGGTGGRTAVQALDASVRQLKPAALALGGLLAQFSEIEAEYRAAKLLPLILAHITGALSGILSDLRALYAAGDSADVAAQARAHMLRVAAARTAVSTIAGASTAANTVGTVQTGHVLEHKLWASGEDGRTTSEVAAVLEGTAGSVLSVAVKSSGATGFTADTEGDAGAGTDPTAGGLTGQGPFSVQLDAGVLVDVSWQPGTQVSDGATTALIDHDGAGNITSVSGPAVLSGTVDYATGLITDLVFDTPFAGATFTAVYQSKSNLRSNYFTDSSADFVSDGVESGDVLELLIAGGPADASGDGYVDRYRVLTVPGPTQLRVSKDATNEVAGGIPEPYTDIAYRVVSSTGSTQFGSLDVGDAAFMSFKSGTTPGDPNATSPTPWLGRTDAADNLLSGPGGALAGTVTRATMFSGTAGWVGSVQGSSVVFNDPDALLVALPYMHEDATSSSLKLSGLFALEITAPAAAAGTYPIELVRVASGNSRAGWEYKLSSTIPTYSTALPVDFVLGASSPAVFTYSATVTGGRLEASSLSGAIASASSAYDFTDDGAGNITGANASGTVDYASGEISVTYSLAPPGGAGNVVVNGETLALTYSVVPLSRVMENGATDPQEVAREVVFAVDLEANFASTPATWPGPGDFVFCGALRPHLFRIQALSGTAAVLQPVLYSAGRDMFPLEYAAGSNDYYFFRAQPGASTADDLHDEFVAPGVLTSYAHNNLVWSNTTNVFHSTDYGAWSSLGGWERLVLEPLGTPEYHAIVDVLTASSVRIDGYVSDQLGTQTPPYDAQVFALEDIVRPGDLLQIPLESDWPVFAEIASVTTDAVLVLRNTLPTWISAQYAAGMDYRIVRSTEATALLDLTTDLGANTLAERGPFSADPNGVVAEQVPGPVYSDLTVREQYLVEVHADGELFTQRIAAAPTGQTLVLDSRVLPAWRRGLSWKIYRTAPGRSPLLRTEAAASPTPVAGDRASFWATSTASSPDEDAADLPFVLDATVNAALRTPLVAAAEDSKVLRLDAQLPRFAEGYAVVHSGAAVLAGRDAILTNLLVVPARTDGDFRSIHQQFAEVRLQQAADETLVFTYPTAPAYTVNENGYVTALRNDPGPPAEDWSSDGVAVNQLVHLSWSSPGYPAVVSKTYVVSVSAREVRLDPRVVPTSSSLGFPAQYVLSAVAFYTNDVTFLLNELGTFRTECAAVVDVLTTYLSGRSAADVEARTTLLKLLEVAGLDRAADLLKQGRFADFVALTASTATYRQRALQTAADVLRVLQ